MQLWDVNEIETAQVLAEYNMLSDEQVLELGIMPLVEKAFAGDPVILPPIEYNATRTAEEIGLAEIKARTRWIQCYLYPIKNGDGELVEVVNTYMDITELKRTEPETCVLRHKKQPNWPNRCRVWRLTRRRSPTWSI